MTMRMWLAVAAAAMATACGPKVDGPDVVVKALYQPYLQGAAAPPPPFDMLDVYTPELKAELDRAATYGNLLDMPVIDADPVVMAQDWEIGAVTVAPVAPVSGDTAQVAARFDNMGHATVVTWDMRQVDGHWRVDNIGTGDDSLRGIIAAALKPVGDPSAMEAPVRAIYAKYAGATTPVEPLHRWAPLTDDLRKKLEAASAASTRGDVAALDFDPVVDDKHHDLGPVAYEAASSAVITRFDNGGDPKIIVYDLIEENGAWKIADIRSPGHWTLTQRLSEAGAP